MMATVLWEEFDRFQIDVTALFQATPGSLLKNVN
jgi:hypothetical protein